MREQQEHGRHDANDRIPLIVENDRFASTSREAEKCLCHKLWLISATPGAPGLSSAAVKVRPRFGDSPSKSKMLAVTFCVGTLCLRYATQKSPNAGPRSTGSALQTRPGSDFSGGGTILPKAKG
jgi:hypothetical protein